jgi:molybdopterin/thiamine biosynthesis adenylyltransferase
MTATMGRSSHRLVFAAGDFTQLRNRLLEDAPLESACFVLAKRASVEGRNRFVVAEVLHLSPEDYLYRSHDRLELSAAVLANAAKRARLNDLSVFLTHSHPGARVVEASRVDRLGEKLWVPAVAKRAPRHPHGRLIISEHGVSAAALSSDSEEPISVHEVGSQLHCYGLDAADDIDHLRNDRQIRAFGVEGQHRLHQLRVGIVGLGGTGSVVAQQLAYLGIRRFLFIDPDTIEASNLNRIVGATSADIGRPKIEVASDHATRIAPDAIVHAFAADVRDALTARSLLDCDLVFCCTDSEGSRAVINQIAYQYLIPVIDLGVAIKSSKGRVTHISGRVQLLAPGEPCLLCCNVLDPIAVRQDLLSEEARRADEYIIGETIPQPAVISINSSAASLAVTMMLAVVTGIPVASRNQRLRLEAGIVSRLAAPPHPDCPICSQGGALAQADALQFPARSA